VLQAASVPVLPGVPDYADMGLIPGGCHRTRSFCSGIIKILDEIPRNLSDIMFDPQTSGGLLFSVKENDSQACLDEMRNSGIDAAIVGYVSGKKQPGTVRII
jgi:selenide,water dikinase